MDNTSNFPPVSVCESTGVIDYHSSRRYPLALYEARRRAMRSISDSRKTVDSDAESGLSDVELGVE